MNKFKILGFGIILFLIKTNAQINIENVSINFGQILNQQVGQDYPKSVSFLYEISCGGIFFNDNFEWDIYLNYWNDDSLIESPMSGHPVYDYNTYTIGFRLYAFTTNKIIPLENKLGLFGGISNFKILRTHISGDNGQNDPGSDAEFNELHLMLGLIQRIYINKTWGINLSYALLYNTGDERPEVRYKISAGINYRF